MEAQKIKGKKKDKSFDKKKRSRGDEDEGINKFAASRKSQFKEAKLLRKAQKPDWELVEEAKRVYNIVKPNDKALVVGDREQLVQELLQMIQGRAAKLVLKHDASRIVQTCVKHGTPAQRQELIEELQPHLLALTKSRYGKFLAMKLFKYGTKEQRRYLVDQLHGKARKMVKQKDAAEVLEMAYSEVMNAAQRQRVVFEIYCPEEAELPESEPKTLRDIMGEGDRLRNARIADDMQRQVDKWTQKEMLKNSVVHAVLWEYCQCMPESRRAAFVESLRELVVHFVHTAAGSKVGHFLATVGGAKDRKVMLKHLKGHVPDMAIDEHGVWVLIRLLDVTDDTRLLTEVIVKPLLTTEDVLHTLVVHRTGSLLWLELLAPASKHYFAPDQLQRITEPSSTSKKPADVRRQELLASVVAPLVACFEDELNTANLELEYGEERMLNNKYAANVLFELAVLPDEAAVAPLHQALFNLVRRYPTALEKFHTSRLLKRLVHAATAEATPSLQQFADQLWDHFTEQGSRFLLYLARTKGAGFVLVAFLDNSRFEAEVIDTMKPLRKKLASLNEPAAKIILKKF